MFFHPVPSISRGSDNARSCVCVCMGFMELLTAMNLCARSQDSLPSMSIRRVYIVFSTAGFKDGGKPCHKLRETAAHCLANPFSLAESHNTNMYSPICCCSRRVNIREPISSMQQHSNLNQGMRNSICQSRLANLQAKVTTVD